MTGYTYASSGQPHRLTSASIDGVFTNFHYDANGNITRYQATGADDTWLDYNARNQVTRITVGTTAGTATPKARDELWYGPDGARFLKRESWDDDSTQKQSLTVYLYGGVYEEVHPLHDSNTDWHRKIQASSAALIRVTKPSGLSTTETIEYLHRDHLGSVHKVTDGQGNILHDLAFDPFGGRRESDWSGDIDTTSLEVILDDLGKNTSRGYTDHEQLDRTGFIHMNGRLYDPRIGRFVQPDPFVPDPTFSQDYNRYAYVANSPLQFTDMSGYCRSCSYSRGGSLSQNADGNWNGMGGFALPLQFSNGGFHFGSGVPLELSSEILAAFQAFMASREGSAPIAPGGGAGSGGGSGATPNPSMPGGGATTPGTTVPDPVIDAPPAMPNTDFNGMNQLNAWRARAYDPFPRRCEACHPTEAELGQRPDVERLNRVLIAGARIGAGGVQLAMFGAACSTGAGCILASPLLISGVSDLATGLTGAGLGELILDEAGRPLDVTMSFIAAGGVVRGPLIAAGMGRSAFPDIYVGVVSIFNSAEGAGRMREARQARDPKQ